MDIQSLNALVAVAESGSFSVAAERLHLTQPAISKRIAGLERELGIVLFDRTGRRALPTQAGAQLLTRAHHILLELRVAEQEIRDLSDTVSGTLHLATSHHIGLHRLPPVLRTFSDRFPAVRLNIEFTDSEKAHDSVLKGDIELAVITLAPEESGRIEAKLLWPDPLCFVASPEHPLNTGDELGLARLSEHVNVLPGFDTYTGQIVKRLFESEGFLLDTLMVTNYLETIKMMVNVGLGWSVLPKTMLDPGLVELPVNTPPLSRQLGYIHKHRHALSNAARAFIHLLRQTSGR